MINVPRLGVNIDHVATLRQARRGIDPQPVIAARICESAGADSVVAHLREDRRHIQAEDVYLLKRTIITRLNLEMSVADSIVKIALRVRPYQATLVPEKRQELTTEGGLDVCAQTSLISSVAAKLARAGILVSLFIDPVKKQIAAAKKTGAAMIELHTGEYASAVNASLRKQRLQILQRAAEYARGQGLIVAAGHGLGYQNVAAVARIGQIEEFNIGYAIVCRALTVGLGQAVREMKQLLARAL